MDFTRAIKFKRHFASYKKRQVAKVTHFSMSIRGEKQLQHYFYLCDSKHRYESVATYERKTTRKKLKLSISNKKNYECKKYECLTFSHSVIMPDEIILVYIAPFACICFFLIDINLKLTDE